MAWPAAVPCADEPEDIAPPPIDEPMAEPTGPKLGKEELTDELELAVFPPNGFQLLERSPAEMDAGDNGWVEPVPPPSRRRFREPAIVEVAVGRCCPMRVPAYPVAAPPPFQ